MTASFAEKVCHLHDAYVRRIGLEIDDMGRRTLTMLVHCSPDCGLEEWNDKRLQIEFVEPLVILGSLLGHMANAEEVNTFDFKSTPELAMQLGRLLGAGIGPPRLTASILFQSGSKLDVACEDIRITDRS